MAKPFVKGDPRINRKGRPKKGKSLADKIEDLMNEVLDPVTGYTVLDSMLDAQKKKALQGNIDAFELLTNRRFGKVVERVETNNTNKNYDFTKLSIEERTKLLELISSVNTTVPSNNPDSE